MRYCLFIVFCFLVIGCHQKKNKDSFELTSEVTQRIATTPEQEVFFGHYENVNTVYGGSYEGCCILTKNRVKLASFVINLYEEKTGVKFEDQNILIGTTDKKIMIYIQPNSYSENLLQKTYFIRIDKKSAELEEFVVR